MFKLNGKHMDCYAWLRDILQIALRNKLKTILLYNMNEHVCTRMSSALRGKTPSYLANKVYLNTSELSSGKTNGVNYIE